MAGMRVDDVVVANTLFFEEPFVVPGGGNRGVNQRNSRDHVALALSGIAYAHHPWFAEPVADDPAVAAGAHIGTRVAERFQHIDAAIHGIALGNAAEIDPNSLLREIHRLIFRI